MKRGPSIDRFEDNPWKQAHRHVTHWPWISAAFPSLATNNDVHPFVPQCPLRTGPKQTTAPCHCNQELSVHTWVKTPKRNEKKVGQTPVVMYWLAMVNTIPTSFHFVETEIGKTLNRKHLVSHVLNIGVNKLKIVFVFNSAVGETCTNIVLPTVNQKFGDLLDSFQKYTPKRPGTLRTGKSKENAPTRNFIW